MSSSSLAFPATTVGQRSAAQSLLLSNTGQGSLSLAEGLQASGPFSLSTNCPTNLSAGQQCAVQVEFVPVAAGAAIGVLTLGSTQVASLSGSALGADPLASSVAVLAHFDAITGAVTADSSTYRRSLTLSPGAVLSAQAARFGAAGLALAGTGGAFVEAAAEQSVATGSFTVEFHVRLASTSSSQILVNKAFGTSYYPFQVYYNAGSQRFSARGFDSGLALVYNLFGTTAPETGRWYHIALVGLQCSESPATCSGQSTGRRFTLYVDGVMQESVLSASSYALYENGAALSVGAYSDGTYALNGALDEFRFTRGAARYLSNFSPPTSAFDNP